MNTIRGKLDSGRTDPSPEIDCWLPDKDASGIGIIIFQGGAYSQLSEHEGEDYARYFCNVGIACFVVKYRLGPQGHHHPAMLEDALAAIYTVRTRAAELAIDPHKLGVMGSSAGGHLAAHTLVAWQQYDSDISLRPDFGVLCYPVITSLGEFAHKGFKLNLVGDSPSPELLDEISCERHVSAETPPCFVWHTGGDTSVHLEHSILFASALRKARVPFELHLYQRGAHGLGLNTPFDWGAECARWIEEIAQPSVALRRGKPRA